MVMPNLLSAGSFLTPSGFFRHNFSNSKFICNNFLKLAINNVLYHSKNEHLFTVKCIYFHTEIHNVSSIELI